MDGPADLAESKHQTFQAWEWRWQRVGWILLAVLVIAALAGVLGDGPLSSTQLSSSDGALQASFDRFLHRSDPAVIVLRVSAEMRSKSLRVHVGSAFLRRVRILRITPEPQSEIARQEGIDFLFESAGAPADITFHFEPEEWGPLQSDFALDAGSQVSVEQFVYP